jgi:hypothetical protein
MAGPSWLAGTFAVLMLVTAGYCAGRLAAARWWRRATEHDVDLVHSVMGVAMAGMLVPRLDLLRHGGWEIVFAAATAWFGCQIIRYRRDRPGGGHQRAHHLPHMLACGAMLYMLVAAGTAGAGVPTMADGGPSANAAHSPGLALPLALAMLGYVIWTTDRLTALPRVAALAAWMPAPSPGSSTGSGLPASFATGRASRPQMSPRLAACCEIAMGITMGYMLIQML